MDEIVSPIRVFVAELRRRRVPRVAGNYALVCCGILVVEEIVAQWVGVPWWTRNALAVGAMLGFPVAVLLGWLLERGADGHVRLAPAAYVTGGPAARDAAAYAPLAGRTVAFLALVVLVALVGFAAFARLDPPPPGATADPAPATTPAR